MKAPGAPPTAAIARLMRLVRISTADGCWEWLGATRGGYGRIRVGSRTNGTRTSASTHRLTYQHYVGPIPEGMQLDHLCRNRACCNPAHLEPVTQSENIQRGDGPTAHNTRKTHCPAGHEYDGTNLYIRPDGGRGCRACKTAQRLPAPPTPDPSDSDDDSLLMAAWGLLANVSGGEWGEQHSDWVAAVVRWRDQFHAHLGDAFHNQPAPPAPVERYTTRRGGRIIFRNGSWYLDAPNYAEAERIAKALNLLDASEVE